MKEKIVELAKEVWDYNSISLEIPAQDLWIEAEADSTTIGAFHISNAEGKKMKGRAYLHGNTLLRLTKAEFSGEDCLLPYEFSAEGLLCGETQKGILEVYADCGYLTVECKVQVILPYVDSSIGRLDNFMRFTELCKRDWKEALQIFRSSDFERVFLKNDERIKKIYEGLLRGEGNSNALEEFLIATRKKQPVRLFAQKNNLSFSKVMQEREEIIVLKRSTWGYGKYIVSSNVSFLVPDRNLLWADAFIGDELSLGIKLLPQYFHQGKNIGKIILKSVTDSVEITVEVTEELSLEQIAYLRKRKHEKATILQLLKGFRGFLAGFLKGENYAQRQKNLINELEQPLSADIKELCKLHFMEVSGNQELAQEMLRKLQLCGEAAKIFGEHCREEMKQGEILSSEKIFIYGCYLYFNVLLYDREGLDERAIFLRYLDALRKQYPLSDAVLYLYIAAALETMTEPLASEKEKWTEELSEYLFMLYNRAEKNKKRTDSSFLYILSCRIWNLRPDMLVKLDNFSVAALFTGIRYKILSKSLKSQFTYLAGSANRYQPLVFHAMVQLYQENDTDEVLSAMLRHLIRGQQAGRRYYPYFRLGIERHLKITQLYEYFMDSMDEEDMGLLPSQVLTYFQYACSLPDRKKAALYANIISNRSQDTQTYLNYQKQMERFALEQVAKHKISRNLSIIYSLLDSTNMDIASEGHLAQIIFRQELICHQPEMTGFYVLYEERKKEEYIPLISGKALVNLATDQAVLLFEDSNGGRHYSTSYTINKLFCLEELCEKCMESNPENELLMINLLKRVQQKKNFSSAELFAMEKALSVEEVSEMTKGNVWMALLEYYYENFNQEMLSSLLAYRPMVTIPSKKRLAEIYISTGNMEEAYELIKEDKTYHILQKISMEKLSSLVHWRLEQKEMQPEEIRFLTKACQILFKKNIADKEQIAFLMKNMEGTIGEMLTLWKSSQAQEEEFRQERCMIGESIISHALFSQLELAKLQKVFITYYKDRENFKYTEHYHITELVVRAFFFVYASKYLHDQEIEQEEIFSLMFQELQHTNIEACKYAMLKYFSKKSDHPYLSGQLSWIEKNAKECVEAGIVFPFFRNFRTEVRLPSGIKDACYVAYTAKPSNVVTLHYCYKNAKNEGEYETQVMKNRFQGIHIKSFLLFYDERLLYYITEEQDGKEIARTDEQEIRTEQESGGKENSFTMINMILAAKDMQDDVTMRQGMEHYIETFYAQKQLFTPFLRSS